MVFRREREPEYDRVITDFSPDGRLLQVEYGMKAAERGDTVAAIATEHVACLAVDSQKTHRVDAHVLMVTAGLSGDALAMATTLRQYCQEHRYSYGEAPTVQEVAEMAATIQHDQTRMAGSRPLGCTCLIVGVDGARVSLFKADPGGIVDQYYFCAAGRNHPNVMDALEKLHTETSSQETIKADYARGVAEAVLQEKKKEKEEENRTTDIWIVEKDPRGKNPFVCIKGIDEDAAASIASQLRSKAENR